MPVTDITTDPQELTMTLVAEFPAPVERLWQAFTDPQKLGRFWGPPTWPATFSEFELVPGGRARYHMTGPSGEHSSGFWEFVSIDEPRRLEVLDGFADESGAPAEGMPTMRMVFTFEDAAGGSRLRAETFFASAEALEQVMAMGMAEGMRQAVDQLDAVLQDLREYAQGKGTRVELVDAATARITRLVDGPRELVWRAYQEPELIRRWLLGPDGWRMTLCEVDARPGGGYRFAWAPEPGVEGEEFGFHGDCLFAEAPFRAVTTEYMTGTDFPPTTNDLQLFEEDGATLITTVIRFADEAARDAVLATGMADGMEDSFARMEREILAS